MTTPGKNIFLVFIVVTIVFISPKVLPAFSLSKGQQAVIERFISKQVKKEDLKLPKIAHLQGWEEGKEVRIIVTGVMYTDVKLSVVAVEYLLQQGNADLFYLVVFSNHNGKLKFEAQKLLGGRCSRHITLRYIRNGSIYCDVDGYEPDDPCCCPSRKGIARYNLRTNSYGSGTLIEAGGAGKKAIRRL
jgi:hypothetical protein